MAGWVAGWVAGLFGNRTNSAPNWVGLGLGLSLATQTIPKPKPDIVKKQGVLKYDLYLQVSTMKFYYLCIGLVSATLLIQLRHISSLTVTIPYPGY